ncbi:hypothetical protein TcasGA2_TC033043 [Tribolium castaneum]|uniref:Uncharacterized protein n=1 Tax=Tribolium castaneum TaxID=7070 RepID=A0A139WI99_TRICA|nr:hypothetical protein TcasGA2_TC033043 [Tribolium castaneum]
MKSVSCLVLTRGKNHKECGGGGAGAAAACKASARCLRDDSTPPPASSAVLDVCPRSRAKAERCPGPGAAAAAAASRSVGGCRRRRLPEVDITSGDPILLQRLPKTRVHLNRHQFISVFFLKLGQEEVNCRNISNFRAKKKTVACAPPAGACTVFPAANPACCCDLVQIDFPDSRNGVSWGRTRTHRASLAAANAPTAPRPAPHFMANADICKPAALNAHITHARGYVTHAPGPPRSC